MKRRQTQQEGPRQGLLSESFSLIQKCPGARPCGEAGADKLVYMHSILVRAELAVGAQLCDASLVRLELLP